MKGCLQFIDKIKINSLANMDFNYKKAFEKKYILIILQRGKLYNFMVCITSLYSFYVDFTLYKNNNIDMLYKKTLLLMHIIILLLSIVYIIIFKSLENTEYYKFSFVAKAVIISDAFLAIFLAALISLNSQRYFGNIDVYIISLFAVALIIPIFPRIMFAIYIFNQTFFLFCLSFFHKNNDKLIINQLNSTIVAIVAFILFFIMYTYHATNFLNEERIKEDRLNLKKLFEMNPFPLVISRIKDGKILVVNHNAMIFYDITKEQFDTLNLKHLYRNASDLELVLERLERNGVVHDYVVEHKTFSGQNKWVIVNYELMDYFGEKAILSGISDITEIKRIENELIIHASKDILTGVLNRRVGMDIIKKKLERAKLEREGFSLCFADIDKLKVVNDKFGHKEGDFLITEVCKVIKEEIQTKDIIFRYGGDEFIILFEDKSEDEVNEICTTIKHSFVRFNKNKCKPYLINASLGVFTYEPEMNLNIEQIIELADKEMYKDKLEYNYK